MYLPSKRIRTRSRVERFQPEFKEREERASSQRSSSIDHQEEEMPEMEISETNISDQNPHTSPVSDGQGAVYNRDKQVTLGSDPWSFPVSETDNEISPARKTAPSTAQSGREPETDELCNSKIRCEDKHNTLLGNEERLKRHGEQDVALDRCI